MSTYLLSGDPTMYHPDSDLATWAMVVVHLLTQPSLQSWMKAELLAIQALHQCVYWDQNTSWRRYLALVASSDFKLGLVTQSAHLPPYCRCPHLNKFMLACFLLRDQLSLSDMEARRDAAVLEFFGRSCKVSMLPYMYNGKFETTVDHILNSTPITMKHSLRETIKDFTAKIHRYNWRSLQLDVVEPDQHAVRISSMNLSCATVVNFFSNLCEGLGPLSQQRWIKLFLGGLSVQDSYKRNTAEPFDLPREKVARDIRWENFMLDAVIWEVKIRLVSRIAEHVYAWWQEEKGDSECFIACETEFIFRDLIDAPVIEVN